ncbi:hypothetical protein [Staphylococcus shinii]|uniref:hypothetical protein n=1 Tax=Staphylococcus shinii TaxID=2912228 RepID=UPI00057BE0F3|nr:hypothetical protein [Staphylococcus shinii]
MKTKENPEMPMVPKAYLKTVEHQRDQYKAERDTLIDDIAVLKANISRLERENEEKTKVIILYKKAYEKAHKGWFRYRELTNHIRLKAEMNPSVSRYIDLVNYIDRLERADDER